MYEGKIIKFYREKYNITPNQLGHGICSKSQLSEIENNQVNHSIEVKNKLTERLGIDLELEVTKLNEFKLSNLDLSCKLFNISPKQMFLNTNKASLLIEIAKDSDAIFIAPKIVYVNHELIINEDVKMIPIKEENQFFEIDLLLIYYEAKGLSNLASDFIKDFLEYIDEFCK